MDDLFEHQPQRQHENHIKVVTLNRLEVVAGDIQNGYLNAPNKETSWMKCGPECGADDHSKTAIIQRALYGQKSTRPAY